MGLEAVCHASYAGQASEGKALLESTELIFRGGDFRLRMPFREITFLKTEAGALHAGYNGSVAVFELGAAAEKWVAKIQNPRGLLDKLGVKQAWPSPSSAWRTRASLRI